jgi:hypothetical protein
MERKKPAKLLKTLAMLLLCLPLPLRAATNDDFTQGYASAVLEREFRTKNFALSVIGEAVRVVSDDLGGADPNQVIAALMS